MESAKQNTLVWAFNPFENDKTLQKKTALAIQLLNKNLAMKIQPVYLWGNLSSGVPFQPMNLLIPEVSTFSQTALDHLVQEIPIPNLEPIQVLARPSLTQRQATEWLINFARSENAEFIVVNTHACKGPKRLLLGSFTETLMLNSDIPIFIVNPHSDVHTLQLNHILFPTDFSEESRSAFNKALKFAKQLRASMTLFHKVEFPGCVPTGLSAEWAIASQEACEEVSNGMNAEIQKWAMEGKNDGILCHTLLDSNPTDSVADAILKLAKRRPGIIAMASHSDLLTRTLMGSTTRKVARSSNCPVWIIHPHSKSASQSNKVEYSVNEKDIDEDLKFHGQNRKVG